MRSRSLVPVLVLVTLACPRTEEPVDPAREVRRLMSGVAPEHCQRVLRQAEDLHVVGWANGQMTTDKLPCHGGALCFDGADDAVALRQVDDALDVRVGTHRWRGNVEEGSKLGGKLHGVLLHHGLGLVAMPEGWLLLDAREAAPLPIPPLKLEEDESVTSVRRFPTGHAVTVVNRERCDEVKARRLVWIAGRPEPMLERVPDGAEPMLSSKRGLLGWYQCTSPQTLTVTRVDGARVDFPVPCHNPPTVDMHTGVMVLHGAGEVQVSIHDGKPFRQPLVSGLCVTTDVDRALVLDPREGVLEVTSEGFKQHIPAPRDRDMAGTRLPAGSVREKVRFYTHGARREVLVNERIRHESCYVEDRIHLLDLATRKVTTLASGDRVRMHPQPALGGWYWVEGTPRYQFLDREENAFVAE
ncbi:MAG: hypothetical protein AB2A00_15775 [Myxococcota bacterium]